MRPKERVLMALNHEEPDRVPVDLGGWVTTMQKIAYDRLLRHLGMSRETQAICFWGGVDTQRVLPEGSPRDVENEVRHVIRGMAPGGGFVMCAVHNIQAEVPPENILALYDAGRKWGNYPICQA